MRMRAFSATVPCKVFPTSRPCPKSTQLASKILPKSIQNGTTGPPKSVQNGTWAILRLQISAAVVFMTASLVRDAASGLQNPPNSHPKSSQNRS